MRKCTPADKRAVYQKSIALIISLAMMASGLSAGPAFAAEDPGNGGEDANTEYTETDAALQPDAEAIAEDSPSAEAEPVPEGETEVMEDEAAPELQPDAEQPSAKAKAAGTEKQPIRVVLETGANKRTLLQPDSKGIYYYNSKNSNLRETQTVKVLISNPAACSISYSDSNMAGNTGGEFLEAELISQTVNDPESLQVIKDAVNQAGQVMGELNEAVLHPDPDTPAGSEYPAGSLQVTELSVKINGTGQDNFTFKAEGSEVYAPVSGTVTVKQTRPTSVISRTASVKNKSVSAWAASRTYREKYFKIIRYKRRSDRKVYRYRTVSGAFEVKRASGVSEGGYRAVQGGNSDGTYAYTAMGKKGSKTYCKIVKTRLSDMKVVKVSGDLKLDHANDITFDPAHYRLVVTHNDQHRKRVSFVNPDTLKVTGYKDISVPTTLKGATKAQLSEIDGFCDVTYMQDGKYAGNFIAVISGEHNFLVLDPNLKPIEYITVATRISNSHVYYQGADNINGNLYIALYPKDNKYNNMIAIYDMDGEFKGKITLNKGYELENVFHSGSTIYVTLYKKVKKTWYTTKAKKKKIKLSKKERAKLKKLMLRKQAKKGKKGKKKKIKVPKYKTIVKLKKIKHTKKVKRSYIYQMGMVTL